ncbi:GNAT family N-acetyltransferase [Mycobacterium sp. SMC-16]|uniref:GNAT family N-acetyltransferase n=1 Tax=Mycobacteriaceae TaxID=1762 RepID=UPI0009EBF342|nr:GNAT family N-acetyltransferase [Mycolicibacterium mucogenicum]
MDGNTALFCSTSLAGRIEHAEAQLIALASAPARQRDRSGFATPLGGGMACFAEPGSPMNKVVGLGFDGALDPAALAAIELEYAIRETPTQIELSSLADREVAVLLSRRGYQLVAQENVLGRRVDRALPVATSPRIDVRVCSPEEFDDWVDVVVAGTAHPDDEGVGFHEQFSDGVIERDERDFYDAGATMYIGLCDGVIAGGASMVVTDGIAQFTGAATAPAYRRRGIQNALLARRLADAAEAGCDIAVITTAPGSKSQENAQRRGFQLLYTRAMLIKPVDSPIHASGSGENGSDAWKLVSAQGRCISSETAGTNFAETVRIVPFDGDRRDLVDLFRLAEDSDFKLDGYLDAGSVWVAMRGSAEIVGHIQVIVRGHGETWEVANMAVAVLHRGSGVGRRLLEHVIDEARAGGVRRVQLATATADIGNLRFYQRCGFRLGHIVHDAFGPHTGYPAGTASHGIAVRDQVWFERVI